MVGGAAHTAQPVTALVRVKQRVAASYPPPPTAPPPARVSPAIPVPVTTPAAMDRGAGIITIVGVAAAHHPTAVAHRRTVVVLRRTVEVAEAEGGIAVGAGEEVATTALTVMSGKRKVVVEVSTSALVPLVTAAQSRTTVFPLVVVVEAQSTLVVINGVAILQQVGGGAPLTRATASFQSAPALIVVALSTDKRVDIGVPENRYVSVVVDVFLAPLVILIEVEVSVLIQSVIRFITETICEKV